MLLKLFVLVLSIVIRCSGKRNKIHFIQISVIFTLENASISANDISFDDDWDFMTKPHTVPFLNTTKQHRNIPEPSTVWWNVYNFHYNQLLFINFSNMKLCQP